MAKIKANRNYKSCIFEMIFQEKGALLELYNAINGTNYQNPEDLEINTLENALIRIPTPQFIVFYNGAEEQPERQELKLSNAYTVKNEKISLELTVLVLNVNLGQNEELMESCKTLKDYAIYVDKVRKYRKTMDLADAIDHAAEECIEEGVMTEFLHRNRKKVKELSILEYTAEQAIAYSWEDGCEEGERRKLKEQVRKKLAKGKTLSEIADDLEEEESVILNLIDEISSN